MRSTKAIINLKNLAHNIKSIKKIISKDSKLCVAVKADAYGHGAVECAKTILENGGEALAVATVEEGIELRNAGISSPILMLSLCSPEEISNAIKYNLIPFVFDKEYIELFAKEAEKLGKQNYKVFLAVDTGMGRIGCFDYEAGKLAEYIESFKSLNLGGISTHFAVSDCCDTESKNYTQEQIKKFNSAVKNIESSGINPGIKTCANSAAALFLKESNFDMVRIGIIAYGYYPGDFTKKYLSENGINIDLKPVMTLETEVCAIREIKKGMSISYGRTWIAPEDTKIAVLPIGYADGLFRKYGQFGLKVAINGKEYKVCGRICMDQCMVDLGNNSDVKRWDKVIIFGDKSENAMQDADDIANANNTISYEVTTCITKRVERIFLPR